MTGGGTRRGLSPELRLRIVSGVVLTVCGIAAVGLGGWPDAIWVGLGCGLMIWELTRMYVGPSELGRPAAALAIAAGAAGAMLAHVVNLLLALTVVVLLCIALIRRAGISPSDRLRFGIIALLIAFAGALFVVLRDMDAHGLLIAFWLPIVVAFGDMGGYFVGRKFGGPKLAPVISPNKTWSGAIGGVLAASASSLAFALLTGSAAGALALIGAATAMAAIGGDLVESWIKRRLGVKDSSNIIPGHGGVMDRFDGLTAATLFIGTLILLRPDMAALW